MTKVLIDTKGLQAVQHFLNKSDGRKRLTSFLSTLRNIDDVDVTFSKSLPAFFSHLPQITLRLLLAIASVIPFASKVFSRSVDITELSGVDLLIITTRPKFFPYSEEELRTIKRYVAEGGALLLMANHSSVPRTKIGDFTAEDRRLACVFGVQILSAYFCCPDALAEMDLVWSQAKGTIIAHNCCGIVTPADSNAHPIAYLSSSMVDIGPEKLSSEGVLFGVALDEPTRGRVIILADSGFIAEPNLHGTGPGLFDSGDNATFIECTLRWLLNQNEQDDTKTTASSL